MVLWLQISNTGICSGLQNALTEAFVRNDVGEQRALVSTAFFALAGIIAGLSALATVAYFYVDWLSIFPASSKHAAEIRPVVAIVLVGFLSTIAMSFVGAICAARQELHWLNLVSGGNAIANICLVTVAVSKHPTMVTAAMATIGAGCAVAGIFTLTYFLRPAVQMLLPRFRFVSLPAWSRIYRSGSAFFVISVCSIALFQTDTYLITRFLSANEVTPYFVASKPFELFTTAVFAVFLQPLWVAYGHAKVRGEFQWVRRIHSRMVLSFGLVYILAIPIALLAGKTVIPLWVGIDATPGPLLILAVGVYYFIRQWTDLHAVLINGMDMMRPMAISAVLHSVLTISITIFLLKKIGVIGVPIAAFIGYFLVSGWFLPLLARRTLTVLELQHVQNTHD